MSIIIGTNGNNTLNGTGGSDIIIGGYGNDTIDAGSGCDLVFAGNGNDLVIHRATGNAGVDAYDGGNGQDTLRLVVSNTLAASAAFQADVAQFQWQINHYGSATSYFSSLGLLVTSFEHLQVVVENGNHAPTAVNDSANATEDTTLTISAASLLANDTDPDSGDTKTLISVQGAVNGTVSLNVLGDVVFTPAANFSGNASFTYTMRDAAGATSTATVTVAVAAAADTPTLSVANARGTENPEIALSISAALTDTDGSETLTVEISGVPAGGTLNHGSESGGVWTVAAADLGSLTFTPPVGLSGPVNLSVVARSTESSNGSTTTSAPQTLTVLVPIFGTSGDDIMMGTAGDDIMYGLGGNDNMSSGPGNDFVDGGTGLDRAIYANATTPITVMLAAGSVMVDSFTDTLRSIEFVRGGSANDSYDATGFNGGSTNAGSNGTFNEFEGMAGTDTITGNGNTRISYVNATGGVDVTLATGVVTGDASVGTDSIMGGVNAVRGSQHNDIIRGTSNNETLDGQGGDDQLGGGPGADTLDGGTGFDTALYGLATGAVTVNLATGTATGAGGNDMLSNIEAVFGSNNFGDTLIGNGLGNTLDGSGGNDVLQGGLGNDTLIGGGGIDIAVFSGSIAAYTFSIGQVAGPDGTDSTDGIELLQFNDAFMLGYALTPIDLSGFVLPNGNPIFGRAVADTLLIGLQASGRLINLGGDNDTLTLTEFGTPTYNLNIVNVETVNSTGGMETVNLQNAANGLTVDLSTGFDALNLSTGNDTVTVTNVETVSNGGGADTVTFLHNDNSAGHTFNLGFSVGNTLILDGSDSNYSVQLFGNMTVVGDSDSGDENVDVTNNQLGTTFDLGAGTDSLTLNSSAFPNSVTVANVEEVTVIGTLSDTIVIAGNSGGITTLMAGGGGDQITASADEDHFRYIVYGDSPYDLPGAGNHDIITGFDAAEDQFVFDGIPAPAFSWGTTSFAGNDFVRVDFNGDADPDSDAGWDMVIQVNGLVGTLSDDNFVVI